MHHRDLIALRQEIETLSLRNQQLESQLRQHQDHDHAIYRFLFDTMDEGFCIIEFFDGPHGPLSDYVHVMANAAYAKHAGIPNVVGQKLREMVPEEANDWIARYGAVLRTGQPLQFEQELVATGRVLSITTFRVEPAQRRQVAVLFKDVTERRKAELALRQLNDELEQRISAALAERRLFAELIDHGTINVYVIDMQMRWLAINRQARQDFQTMYGSVPEVGDSLPAFLNDHPDERDLVLPLWQRALAGEQFIETGTFAQRPYELHFNALRDHDGNVQGAYLFAYDITERVKEQQRLANAEQALRQAQKMEAVGQLSGGIAHDFNNLLGGIINAQELMQRRLDQQRYAALAPLLELSCQSAQRASALVHRLLAFSRQQTLQPLATDVAVLVNSMQALVRPVISHAISLRSEFVDDLWPTYIDPPQLESALLNLCINARDAMPAGGTIDIRGDNISLDSEQAQPLGMPAGDYVRLSVTDTGHGMSEAVAARAIDPFFSTKPPGRGTGLGLSMTYGFVRQSGGQLRLLSSPGQGTRVELYLPRHHEQPAAPIRPNPGKTAANSHPSGQRIVLVEDQAALRLVVGEALKELGYEVEAFENGAAALAHMHKCEQPDLLLSDIGLPEGLNGHQVAERCRQIFPQLKVLFITGYDESAALGDGQLLPGTSILTKPFELHALAERVGHLLENEVC